MKKDFRIIDCFCSWYDLLGYGTPFRDAGWKLDEKNCLENYNRIKKLGDKFYNAFTEGKTLIINDGVIKTFDVNYDGKDASKIINFLIQYIQGFNEMNKIDKQGADFGVRGVFTFGQRYEYISGNFMFEKANKEIRIYYPKEFQMNTAFSKANIIEESGRKCGIEGAYLYFDKCALEEIRTIVDGTKGYSVTDYFEKQEYHFSINMVSNPVITLIFDKKVIEYNSRNIKTEIFKLIREEC